MNNNIAVSGIDISKTAIHLARRNGINSEIHHDSVSDMPFENKFYDGIFSYARLYLLNENER